MMVSKCSRAAVVAGEVVAARSDMEVAVEAMGGETWVAMNMW